MKVTTYISEQVVIESKKKGDRRKAERWMQKNGFEVVDCIGVKGSHQFFIKGKRLGQDIITNL